MTVKEVGGILQLGRDLVVLDATADAARDAPMLTQALLARGRRVFVLGHTLDGLLGGLARSGRLRPVPLTPPLQLFEITAPSVTSPAPGPRAVSGARTP